MELISTHFVKKNDVGYHGNLFGGIMLAWLDEAAAAFAARSRWQSGDVSERVEILE